MRRIQMTHVTCAALTCSIHIEERDFLQVYRTLPVVFTDILVWQRGDEEAPQVLDGAARYASGFVFGAHRLIAIRANATAARIRN